MTILIGVGIYLALAVALGVLNHACSVVSGNHEDPYRDVGNGGCTFEQAQRINSRG